MNKAVKHEAGEGLTNVTEREQMVRSVVDRVRNIEEERNI